MPKNHYERLGVDSKASEEEIKKAFHTLARKIHPDKAVGQPVEPKGPSVTSEQMEKYEKQKEAYDQANEDFKALNEAYKVLKDDNKRAAYDAELKSKKTDAPAPPQQNGPKPLAIEDDPNRPKPKVEETKSAPEEPGPKAKNSNDNKNDKPMFAQPGKGDWDEKFSLLYEIANDTHDITKMLIKLLMEGLQKHLENANNPGQQSVATKQQAGPKPLALEDGPRPLAIEDNPNKPLALEAPKSTPTIYALMDKVDKEMDDAMIDEKANPLVESGKELEMEEDLTNDHSITSPGLE